MPALGNNSLDLHVTTDEELSRRTATVEGAASTALNAMATVSKYPLGAGHPLAHLFGKYTDDPAWGDLEQIIDRNRVQDDIGCEIE